MSIIQSRPKDFFQDYFVNFYVPPEAMWQDFLASVRWSLDKIPAEDIQGLNQITSGVVGVYDPAKIPADYNTFDQNKAARFLVQNTAPFVASNDWGSLALTQQDIDSFTRVYFVWETDGVWTKYTELPPLAPSEYDIYLEVTDDDPVLSKADWLESRKGESATLVLSNWTDGNYIPGSDVAHKGVHWTAPGGASFGDVPGESSRWEIKVGDKPEIKRIQSESYLADHSFTYPVEEICVTYDKLTKLSIGQKLRNVRVVIPINYANTGELKVIALDMNENIKQTLNVSGLVEGVNLIPWEIEFTEDVYIGLQTFRATGMPQNAIPGLDVSVFTTTTRRRVGLEGAWQDWAYPIGLDILVEDATNTTRAIANKSIYIINTATSQLNAKLAAGGVINLNPGIEYIIDDIKALKPGTIINGNNGIIKYAPGLDLMFNLVGKEDIKVRDCIFKGGYPTRPNTGPNYSVSGEIITDQDVRNKLGIGTEKVFNLNDVGNIEIIGNRFVNISGEAIIGKNFNADYLDGVAIIRNTFQHGYLGLELSEAAEYCRISDNVFAYNQINIWNAAGNNAFSNNFVNGGRVNVYVGPGVNDGHASWTGGSLNHAALYGIFCDSLKNGFVFSGISVHGASIMIYRSKGVQVSGSRINGSVFCQGMYHPIDGSAPAGRNVIESCITNGTIFENWQGDESYLVLRNNRWDEGGHASSNNNKE